MKSFGRILLHGLMFLLPIALAAYVVYLLGISVEQAMAPLVYLFLPENAYVPGLGLIIGLALIALTGLLVNWLGVDRCLRTFEKAITRIPIIKPIYESTRDFIGYFSNFDEHDFEVVVMVDLPGNLGSYGQIMGFVTRKSFDSLPEGIGSTEQVAVYLPMSYQIGGFTVVVPADRITPVDMPMEEALRFVFTSGVQNDRLHDDAIDFQTEMGSSSPTRSLTDGEIWHRPSSTRGSKRGSDSKQESE